MLLKLQILAVKLNSFRSKHNVHLENKPGNLYAPILRSLIEKMRVPMHPRHELLNFLFRVSIVTASRIAASYTDTIRTLPYLSFILSQFQENFRRFRLVFKKN